MVGSCSLLNNTPWQTKIWNLGLEAEVPLTDETFFGPGSNCCFTSWTIALLHDPAVPKMLLCTLCIVSSCISLKQSWDKVLEFSLTQETQVQ